MIYITAKCQFYPQWPHKFWWLWGDFDTLIITLKITNSDTVWTSIPCQLLNMYFLAGTFFHTKKFWSFSQQAMRFLWIFKNRWFLWCMVFFLTNTSRHNSTVCSKVLEREQVEAFRVKWQKAMGKFWQWTRENARSVFAALLFQFSSV